jgi:DMSO reductase anchor subunit
MNKERVKNMLDSFTNCVISNEIAKSNVFYSSIGTIQLISDGFNRWTPIRKIVQVP